MESLQYLFAGWGAGPSVSLALGWVTAFVTLIVSAWVAQVITSRLVLRIVEAFIRRSPTHLDDILLRHRFFHRLSQVVPAVVVYFLTPWALSASVTAVKFVQSATSCYLLIIGLLVADAFLDALVELSRENKITRKMPVRSFAQVVMIILFIIVGISMLSLILGRSPAYFIGGMSAMTAVLLLVFKDTILGLVAGVQLSTNNMLQIGDWVEMEKYGADGDVIDIALTSVKVQNWDKTIVTIPTYALISDSFKNWRGMSESGGRRIKRAVYIDMTSVCFCTPEMMERFARFQLITEYLDSKQVEIEKDNARHNVDDSELVNGRRLTNVGTFRAYVRAYLRQHPRVHQNMTFLVRQLPPGDKGLPIEIYVFSNDQEWAGYEDIQADIFDHILAVIPEFDLRVFQNPTGYDMRGWGGGIPGT